MSAVAPIQQLQPFDVDFDEVFRKVSVDIAEVRAHRQIKPLVPEGAVLVGREYSGTEMAPPRIVIIPTGARYAPARRIGRQVGDLSLVNANPNVFWLQWLTFRAECWGPDSPKGSRGSNLYGFSSALELGRQLLGALVRNLGGVPNIQIDNAEFDQPRDVNRLGRLYVLNFAIGTSVTDESWVIAETTRAHVAIAATSPDGSTTETQVVFDAP